MRRPVLKPCSAAGCEASAESQSGEWCRLHRYRVERYGSVDDPRVPRSCRVCGSVFLPARADATTCVEPACKAEAKDMDTRASIARGASRTYRRVPRAAAAADAPLVPFTRGEVAARDRWRCFVCGGMVPQGAAWPDPDSLTLVRADPFGAFSFSNSRLAHLRCSE